jgi:hypothetical protein
MTEMQRNVVPRMPTIWQALGGPGDQAHSKAFASNHAIARSMVAKDLNVPHREATEN